MADNDALRITSTSNPPGLTITGEIDETSYPVLLDSLAAAAGHLEMHIDLSGVTYCDLAGLRAIVCLTEPSRRRPARRVVLHAVPQRFREILQILGWDATPGIDLRN
jgi:anti-anti-sigma regulatory factor